MPSTITDRLNGLTTSVAVKAPCRVATTANITLSGLQTIDGVTLAADDRVLVKDQTTATENGIWIAASGTWTRAADFDGTFDVVGGTQLYVISGTVNGSTYWRTDGSGAQEPGTDSISFTTISGTTTLSSDLASSASGKGDALVAHLPSGTGAVATTVKAQLDKLARFYPEDFGAAGNGTLGGGGSNDAAAINACDLAAAAANGTVVFRNTYRVESQLLMSANWHFEDGTIIRDWESNFTNTPNLVTHTIRGRGTDDMDDFYVDPGPYVPTTVLDGLRMTGKGEIVYSDATRADWVADTTARAGQLYMLCHNFYIGPGMRFEAGGRNWTITFWGNKFKGDFFEIYGGENTYEDGFHVIGGSGGRGVCLKIASGDDAISLNSNFNQAISDWTFVACDLHSRGVYCIKVANYRTGATAAYGATTEAIERITFLNPIMEANGASKNAYVRYDTGTEDAGLVSDCHVIDGVFRGEASNGATTGLPAIYITGSTDCSVSAKISNPSLEAVYVEDAVNFKFDIESNDQPDWINGASSTRRAVSLNDCTTEVNGVFKCRNRGAILTSNADVIGDRIECVSVPDTFSSIQLGGTGDRVEIRERLKSRQAGTDGRGISGIAGSTIYVSRYDTDEARALSSTSNPTTIGLDFAPSCPRKEFTPNAGGSITIYGQRDLDILGAGGASDDLVNVLGGYVGQEIIIRNGQADPATVTITLTNTGNLGVGASRVIDTAGKEWRGRWNGTSWIEVSWG